MNNLSLVLCAVLLGCGSESTQAPTGIGGAGGSTPEPVCGDGVVAGSEECDDGNNFEHDECRECKRTCGNGLWDVIVDSTGPVVWHTEDCEWPLGQMLPECCSPQCTILPGWAVDMKFTHVQNDSWVDAITCYDISGTCKNGVLDSWEGCDDGNAINGDGCSDNCKVETGWVCSPGPCQPLSCFNKTLDPGESDLDCGGLCTGCDPGKKCVVPMDCASLTCSAGTCL